jgi:hypothetical protein
MNASAFATRLAGIEATVGKCADPAGEPHEIESPDSGAAAGEQAADRTALTSVERVTPVQPPDVELPDEGELARIDSTLHAAEDSDRPAELATRIESLRHQLDVVNEVLRRLI